MNWQGRICLVLESSGWRRHAPAGASVLVHAVLLSAVAGMMATALPPLPDASRKVVLAVELVPVLEISEPVPMAGATPPPRTRAPRPVETPSASAEAPAPRSAGPTAPAADPKDRKAGEDRVYLGPPLILNDPGVPPGLASLMGKDPCEARYGPKAKECAGRELAARTGAMDSVMSRSKEDLAQYFAEYMPKCAFKVGCEGGEWISSNGTRSVAKAPPGSADDRGQMAAMAGGPASRCGLNTILGRLGCNPDHTDPGFGD
jgi:hypothetical protein